MNSPLIARNTSGLQAPVIAYPVEASSPSFTKGAHNMLQNNSSMELVGGSSLDDSMGAYSSSLGDANFADDTINISGNFFSQLDSMILAVKNESSALDSMKEKLKEVDGLRNQIQQFTKRLLDADQANLNLKNQLVKAQENSNELRRLKTEAESGMVPLRQELNRVKEQCNKERMGRLAAQQKVNMLKEQLQRLEGINENLDRESKTVPALTESNEILKNDLNQLRRKAREEKSGLQKHIKKLEAQVKEADTLKAIVREISLKLLDVTNNGVAGKSGAANTYGGVSAGIASPAHSTGSNYSHNMRYSSSVPTIPQQANGATNIYYQQQHTGYNAYLHAGDDDEEEDEEDSEDEEEDDDDYDDRSYISVGTIDSHIDCVDSKGHTGSAPSRNDPRPPHTMNHPIQHHQGHSGSNLISGSVESSHQSSSAKKNSMGKNAQTTARKKKSVVRKGAGASVKRSAGGQMNMMHVIQDGGQQQNLTLPRI